MHRRNRLKGDIEEKPKLIASKGGKVGANDLKRKSVVLNIVFGSLILLAFIGLALEASTYHSHNIHPDTTGDESKVTPVKTLRGEADLLQTDTVADKDTNSEQTLPVVSDADEPTPLLDVDGSKLHVIFSTDCSEFQHWQSYLLFHSALQIKQPGHVTRIASGCTDEQAEYATQWHKEHISDKMSKRFHLHLTPHFSSVKKEDGSVGGDYKFFNKPFGLRHWMENGVGMGVDKSTGKPLDEDVVVILIDPDQILLRPLRADFSDENETVTKEKDLVNHPLRVSHGHPAAQKYGLGAQWQKFDLAKITGSADSPAFKPSRNEANAHYPAGPPYLATARDMYQIALKWTEFAPKVHAEYPYLLAEMYAYCIAAAHLELPHLMVESLMVSNTDAGGEGWPLVDKMQGQVCEFDHLSKDRPPAPSVIHYCQRYIVGAYFFGKRKMPKNIFTCESPLLVTPEIDLGEKYPFKYPVGRDRMKNGLVEEALRPVRARREAFIICTATKAVNAAGKYFKENHCESEHQNIRYELDLAKLP